MGFAQFYPEHTAEKRLDLPGQAAMNVCSQVFRGGNPVPEFVHGVKVPEVYMGKDFLKVSGGKADIHHHIHFIEYRTEKSGVHDISGSMQLAGDAESFMVKRMGNHNVITDSDAVHGLIL